MAARHPFKAQPRDTRAHALIEDYLDRHGADSGHVQLVPRFAGHGAANEGRLSVRRGARHYGLSCAAWVTGPGGQPCPGDCPDPAAEHGLCVQLWSKDHGRAHVLAQTGGDPALLRYNPYARRQ